jgi:hypothetical protein
MRPGMLGHIRPPALVRDRVAEAVADLLGNQALWRQLAWAGRAFAEETFDLWRNGRRLAEILRSTGRAARGEAA